MRMLPRYTGYVNAVLLWSSSVRVITSWDAVAPLRHAGVLLEQAQRRHSRVAARPAAVDGGDRDVGGVLRAIVARAQALACGADADVAVHQEDLAAACAHVQD